MSAVIASHPQHAEIEVSGTPGNFAISCVLEESVTSFEARLNAGELSVKAGRGLVARQPTQHRWIAGKHGEFGVFFLEIPLIPIGRIPRTAVHKESATN